MFKADAPALISGVTPKERPKRCRVGVTKNNSTPYDPSPEEKENYCQSKNFNECERFKNRPSWQRVKTK